MSDIKATDLIDNDDEDIKAQDLIDVEEKNKKDDINGPVRADEIIDQPEEDTRSDESYIPQKQEKDDYSGMSYVSQILELLEAGRNFVNRKIDENLSGDNEPITDNGKHNARTFRQNFLRKHGGTASEVDSGGYGADQTRGWRDDLNTVMFNPFDPNREKSKADLGKRAADSAFDLSYETATDPLNWIAGAFGLGANAAKSAGIAGGLIPKTATGKAISNAVKGAAIGGGLGIANEMSHYEDDTRPYIGGLEGASIGLVPMIVGLGSGVVSSAGDKVIEKVLNSKTAEYMGKTVELSKYPALVDTVDKLKKKSAYIAHMIRQGYRKSINNLSDEEALQVNEFMNNAKSLSNELSQEAYYAQAKTLLGEKGIEKFRKEAEENLAKKYSGDSQRIITDQMINTEVTDIALKYHDPSGEVKRYIWNKARDAANKAIKEDPRFVELSSGLSSNGLKSVEAWVEHNKAVRDSYNKAKSFDEVFDPDINIKSSANIDNGVVPNDGGLNLTRIDKDKAMSAIPSNKNSFIEKPKTTYVPGGFAESNKYDSLPFPENVNIFPDNKNVFGTSTVDDLGNLKKSVVTGKRYLPKGKDILSNQGMVKTSERSSLYADPNDIDKLKNQPMVGLDYHTADVYDKEAFEASKELFSPSIQEGFKRGLFGGESDAVQRMIAEGVPPREAYDRAYAVYSEQAAKAFLSSSEKEAMYIVNQGSQYFKDLPGVAVIDALTSSAKKKWLYLNTSWVKTQYWDNLLKATVEGGYVNGAKYALNDAWRKGLSDDIMKALDGVPMHVTSDETNKLLKLGVVDTNFAIDAKNLGNTEIGLRYGPSSKVRTGDNSFAGKIEQWTDQFRQTPGIKQFADTTETIGQRFENNARISTFKSLVKSGIPEEDAASLVQKAFYDYSKVNALGRELGKRVIPFYSFVSKNTQYWPEAMTSVQKLSRINNALTASRQVGVGSAERDPDIGLSIGTENSHLKNGYPQLAAGNNDYVTLYSAPKMSFFDALGMMTNPYKAAQGLTPWLRVPAELASGKDFFSEQPINPEKNPYGKKNWLPASGYTGLLLNKIEPNFTRNFSLADLVADEEGSTSDKMSRLAKGGLSALLGQTSVRPNENTGTPETTSSWPMYYNKISEAVPVVPQAGYLGTLYNAYNTPIVKNAGKSFENMLNEDNGITKGIDILTGLVAPFDTIKKDIKGLEDKQKKLLKGNLDENEKERNEDRSRGR